MGPEQRAGHPPPRGRGVRVRLQRRQRGPRARGARRDRGPGRAGRDGPRLPPLHAAGDGPARAAGRLPAPLRPHPVDAVGRLARAARPGSATRSTTGLLANDIIGFHTRSYRRNFLQCCRDLMELEVDMDARRRARRRPRGVGARVSAADRLRGHAARWRGATGVAEFEERAAAAPARVLDPARRPRRPVEERPARVHRRSTSSSSSTRSSPSGSRSRRS